MHTIYPWQQTKWQYLLQFKNQNKLAHALLFYGEEGLGKFSLAHEFSKLLLCKEQNASYPCDKCVSCKLLKASSHPDLFILQPEDNGKTIKVEQIRGLNEEFCKTSQQGGYKIAIITPADAMNGASANAFLKSLEEPNRLSLFILISARQKALPATIISRCQKVFFDTPDKAVALDWMLQQQKPKGLHLQPCDLDIILELANNSPLRALSEAINLEKNKKLFNDISNVLLMKQDPVALAALYLNEDMKVIVSFLTTFIIKLLRLRFNSAEKLILSQNEDTNLALKQASKNLNLFLTFEYADKLLNLNKAINNNIALNKQLLLETLLLSLANICPDPRLCNAMHKCEDDR